MVQASDAFAPLQDVPYFYVLGDPFRDLIEQDRAIKEQGPQSYAFHQMSFPGSDAGFHFPTTKATTTFTTTTPKPPTVSLVPTPAIKKKPKILTNEQLRNLKPWTPRSGPDTGMKFSFSPKRKFRFPLVKSDDEIFNEIQQLKTTRRPKKKRKVIVVRKGPPTSQEHRKKSKKLVKRVRKIRRNQPTIQPESQPLKLRPVKVSLTVEFGCKDRLSWAFLSACKPVNVSWPHRAR